MFSDEKLYAEIAAHKNIPIYTVNLPYEILLNAIALLRDLILIRSDLVAYRLARRSLKPADQDRFLGGQILYIFLLFSAL